MLVMMPSQFETSTTKFADLGPICLTGCAPQAAHKNSTDPPWLTVAEILTELGPHLSA